MFFDLHSIRLSRFHNPGHRFGRLIQVVFLWHYFFFNFTLQHWVNWELSFIFLLYFISIGLFWFYDLCMVTQLIFLVMFCFQFHHSTLDWLRNRFNSFLFVFYRVIMACSGFSRLIRVDWSRSNMLLI